MDLERIKQNLRLRSGRTKKNRKAPAVPQQKSLDQSQAPNGPQAQNHENNATSQQRRERDIPEKTESKVKNGESVDETEHKSERSQSSSAMNGAPIENQDNQVDLPRYGRSGIEKPQRHSQPNRSQQAMSQPKISSDETDVQDYDLRPPPRKQKPPSLENLWTLLYSEGHLNTILHDPQLLLRLTIFLDKYKSGLSPLLIRFLETQKAVKAVEYANALAATVTADGESNNPDQPLDTMTAAKLDEAFARVSSDAFSSLLNTALPAYVTYSLVRVVTECLTNEITGRSTPIMRDLVGGLSEVFCLADPNQEDNPIIYASEEFYRLTGYDSEDVIGNNCRFLQGPKTGRAAPQRLSEAQTKGEQICETVLNYRRDGRAFLNLLMIAPLYDDKEKLKYYIGAQVDVSRLVEGGKSLPAFGKYIANQERQQRGRSRRAETELDVKKQHAMDKLRELSEMFDLEESAVVRSHSRASSVAGDDESITSKERRRTERRVLGADQSEDEEDQEEDMDNDDKGAWTLARSGPSGKLPGVYERYMMIRPAPSLRIIFVSPALRSIGKIVQSPFLSHVVAPSNTLRGLKESFENEVPVTAKLGFMSEASQSRYGIESPPPNANHKDANSAVQNAKTCWISATPLLDGDDKVGVWMVVMVQKGKGTARALGNFFRPRGNAEPVDQVQTQPPRNATDDSQQQTVTPKQKPQVIEEDMPIKPVRLDSPRAASPSVEQTQTIGEEPEGKENQYEYVPRADEHVRADAEDHNLNSKSANDELLIRRHESRAPPQTDRVVIQPDSDDERTSDSGTEARDISPEGEYEARSRPESPDEEHTRSPSPPEISQDSPDQAEDVDSEHSDRAVTPTRHSLTSHSRQDQGEESTPTPKALKASGPDQSEQSTSSPPVSEDSEQDQDEEFTSTPPASKDPGQDEDEDEDEESSSTPPASHETGPESNSARPSGMLYMDYLRHPGSGRKTSAMPWDGDEDGEDPDCASSPYSVD